MDAARLKRLAVGEGAETRSIAVLKREGKAPGLFWLGGFRSDMGGAKATALDDWAAGAGQACVRFDYSGHGQSEGRFEDGTVSRWLDEAEKVFTAFASGPQIVVGSSMGGWIALLLAALLRKRGETGRIAGMVLIAPAVDMTKTLIVDRLDQKSRRKLMRDGFHAEPSAYFESPTLFTRALIEDGAGHLFGEAPIEAGCPVHVIQGMQDADVPWRQATALMEKFAYDDAVLTLVRDGDHRLSRPEDIERLLRVVESMVAG